LKAAVHAVRFAIAGDAVSAEMNAQVLSELTQIKWLLVVFVMVAVAGIGLRMWAESLRSRGLGQLLKESFGRRAGQLLDEARYQELLSLAQSRCKEAPGDAYAFWYHAVAAHRVGDAATALQSMRKVGELEPSWRESHVDPFVSALAAGDSTSAATAAHRQS
jgi:hypothetical protein